MDDEGDKLRQQLNFSTDREMVEQVAYGIWACAVSTTRAFGKIQVRVDPGTQRVFVVVQLRWIGKKLKRFHNFWLERCEKKCRENTPPGWKLLAYYDKKEK